MHWRNIICYEKDKAPPLPNKIQVLDKLIKLDALSSKMFYWIFVKKKFREPSCKCKWEEYFPLFKNADITTWPRIFEMPFKITHETKLQSFQYRVIHRIIPCNKWLHMVNIKANDMDRYCKPFYWKMSIR